MLKENEIKLAPIFWLASFIEDACIWMVNLAHVTIGRSIDRDQRLVGLASSTKRLADLIIPTEGKSSDRTAYSLQASMHSKKAVTSLGSSIIAHFEMDITRSHRIL